MPNNAGPGRMGKRISLMLVVGILILADLATCSTAPSSVGNNSTATPTRATPSQRATPTAPAGLEDDASQWDIFYDGGKAVARLENVAQPSVDGKAFKIALESGQPYVGIHAYRNLSSAHTSKTFDLSLSFYLPLVAPIQALEFTISTWMNNQRWEWALQWENIGDGTSQQGNPPTWRLWTGKSWQNLGVRQQLKTDTWHTLHLMGDIVEGQVHYISMSCDDIQTPLGQKFAPVSSSGDKLAVAVQLDGNSQEAPYQVYIDGVILRWS